MVLNAGRPAGGSGHTAAVVRWRSRLVLAGLAASAAAVRAFRAPFPASGENPFLDLLRFNDPAIHAAVRAWQNHWQPGSSYPIIGMILRLTLSDNRSRK